jgi:exosortase D (VPLPA-CTERM-specific)
MRVACQNFQVPEVFQSVPMSAQSLDNPASAAPVWRSPWLLLALVLLVALLSVWPFWDGLYQLYFWWKNSPDDNFGVLVPPVVAFLIWQQKDRLERVPFTGSWWGLAVILLGGALLALGQLGTIFTLVQYAFVVTFYGIVLSLIGWRAVRIILVPLLVLLFTIPLPQIVMANLSLALQLLSSRIGVFLIRLLGISVFLEGNVIDLGTYKLQVADACSGLRYLFPLMTLGYLIAYFYKGALWKRIVLFLSSVPITVLMNSLRIGIIGVTVDRWGVAMAEGFLHEFQGWMIFMASAALLLLEMILLSRIGHESGGWRQLFGVELPAATPRGVALSKRGIPRSFLAASGLIVAFLVISVLVTGSAEFIPTRAYLAGFPQQLGPWRGRRSSLEGVYLDALQLDDYLLADYEDGAHVPVNLYISWYNSQRKGEAVHSPRACLPAGGWQMRDFGQRALPGVAIDGRTLRVNRAVIERDSQRELVYYWFQQRGRAIDSEWTVKWFLFWDAVTRHRSDGAMVRLVTPVIDGSSVADADRRLTNLLTRIAPSVTAYIPD